MYNKVLMACEKQPGSLISRAPLEVLFGGREKFEVNSKCHADYARCSGRSGRLGACWRAGHLS